MHGNTGHAKSCALQREHPHGTPNNPLPKHLRRTGQDTCDVTLDAHRSIADTTERPALLALQP